VPQQIETYTLDNGMTVAVEPMPHLRSAAWTLLLPSGAATDPEGRSGSATLLNGMLYRGAGERDARQLSDALDALGVLRGGGVSTEYTTLGGALLADDFEDALAIYADIACRPLLPAEELEAERGLALQALQAVNDNPAQQLFMQLGKVYFPGPFGRPALGEVEELRRIVHSDLVDDHAARYCPDGSILAVAGGVEPERVREAAERMFGDWRGTPPATPRPEQRTEPYYQHLPKDTNQTQIGVAYGGRPMGDEHYYHERLALNVLSGGMGARLFTEVREKRGLVYSVAAVPRVYRGLGLTLGYAGTQPERAQECVDVLLNELRRIRDGVAEDELAMARTGLLSALVMQGESTSARAGAMASDLWLLGRPRPLDEIRSAVDAITLDGLNRYLAGMPEPQFTVLTLGPEAVNVSDE